MRLLLSALLSAPLVAAPVCARELKVATWNLDWLTLRRNGDPILPDDVHPKTAADRARLRDYAALLDADVVALEEVDGPEAVADIFPPDRYRLFFTRDKVVQRVGFAVRRELDVVQNPDLTALDVQPTARFPLRSGADITLRTADGALRFLAVHLKTGCQRDPLASVKRECATLRAQSAPLDAWIAERRRDGTPFVVLGDFNREMDGPDDLFAGMSAAAPLLRATAGQGSPCWTGSSFIDHIMAGGAARGWMDPATLRVLRYRETDPAEHDHLSDHCPVSVRLHIGAPAGTNP